MIVNGWMLWRFSLRIWVLLVSEYFVFVLFDNWGKKIPKEWTALTGNLYLLLFILRLVIVIVKRAGQLWEASEISHETLLNLSKSWSNFHGGILTSYNNNWASVNLRNLLREQNCWKNCWCDKDKNVFHLYSHCQILRDLRDN